MAYILRPYRRVPVVTPVTYEHWSRQGQGTVWNLSSTGWRLSGNLPLTCGDVCSLNVELPTYKPITVAAGIVRWVRGEDYGIETLLMERTALAHLHEYIQARMREL